MSTFDPDRPARLHDRLKHQTFDWNAEWAEKYRRNAVVNMVDGTVSWDGLVLDGWEPPDGK